MWLTALCRDDLGEQPAGCHVILLWVVITLHCFAYDLAVHILRLSRWLTFTSSISTLNFMWNLGKPLLRHMKWWNKFTVISVCTMHSVMTWFKRFKRPKNYQCITSLQSSSDGCWIRIRERITSRSVRSFWIAQTRTKCSQCNMGLWLRCWDESPVFTVDAEKFTETEKSLSGKVNHESNVDGFFLLWRCPSWIFTGKTSSESVVLSQSAEMSARNCQEKRPEL